VIVDSCRLITYPVLAEIFLKAGPNRAVTGGTNKAQNVDNKSYFCGSRAARASGAGGSVIGTAGLRALRYMRKGSHTFSYVRSQ